MMTIVRIDAEARWSDVVIHNNTLYYTGVPENLDADAFEQTANTLAQIDAVLEKQGSNKSSILDATIFLADKNDFAAMNKAWDAWVVAGHAPVRCTVQAGLMNPKYGEDGRPVPSYAGNGHLLPRWRACHLGHPALQRLCVRVVYLPVAV